MTPSRIVVPLLRPRNPLAKAARARRAGAHGPDQGAQRQAAQRSLRHELADLRPPPWR